MGVKIEFAPVGRRGICPADQSLLECSRQLGVDLLSVCGGNGTCERCKVQVLEGKLSNLTPDEISGLTQAEIDQRIRLACQAYPLGDVRLNVPIESLSAPQRAQVEGLEVDEKPDGVISFSKIKIEAAGIDQPEDSEGNVWQTLREQSGLPEGTIDPCVREGLAASIREPNCELSVAVRRHEIIGIGSPLSRWYGLAVDVGTTKIAAYLLDLESGQTMASLGSMNPQIAYGEDVVTRIAVSNRPQEKTKHLRDLLIDEINRLTAELCGLISVDPASIVDAVVVGNTAMHHFFLGLPISQLGVSPYSPAIHSALDVKARQVGLKIAQGAYVHLLPNIAGFVGADHTAMLLASDICNLDGIIMGIDIGTNTEICMNAQGRLTSLSCASGPAFEGAHIKFGMRAATGAIEHVRFEDGRLQMQTIGGSAPVGLCGSGLLDLVAELRRIGILDRSGRMLDGSSVQEVDGVKEYILINEENSSRREPIVLTQKDVRELQLAKAAIRTGIQVLCEANELKEGNIEQVVIAGAFGSYIDIGSAMKIGMLPDLPLHRFKQIGNAAGSGARLALISGKKRKEAQQIAGRVGYIELATWPDFQKKFTEAIPIENIESPM